MVLSDADIEHFQELHKQYFGTEISKEDAYQKGVRLVRMMEIIMKANIKK